VSYCISTQLKHVVKGDSSLAPESLPPVGLGVLTEIDVQATLRERLDVDLPAYMILGACNPPFAYQALQAEEKIGKTLP